MIHAAETLIQDISALLDVLFLTKGGMHAGALLIMTLMIPFFSVTAVYSNTRISQVRLRAVLNQFPDLPGTTFYKLLLEGVRKTRWYKYVLPILILTAINIFMTMILLDGREWTDVVVFEGRRIFLLCGDNCWGDKRTPPLDVSLYQTETVGVLSYAFLGWTVWTLTAIFDRAASHHLFPATFYRLILRLVVALMIAAPVRHLTHDMPSAGQLTGVVLAFIVGMFPERGLKLITDTFEKLVRSENRSEDFDLEWIEGIDGALTFRLRELNVTNAHDLAVANPFSIAEAIAQPLSAVTDWIAQAQLLILLKSDKMKRLRDCGVRTIFDLVGILKSNAGDSYLKDRCGWEILPGYDFAAMIESDGEYRRLLEVHVALGAAAPGKAPVAADQTGA